MRTEPEPRTRLVDLSRLAGDAGPVLAWYEWYADPDRRPLEPDDIARLVDALGPLEAYAEVHGPVGDATVILLAGGLGYSTEEHLDALDVLQQISSPDRSTRAAWREDVRPHTFIGLQADEGVPHGLEVAGEAPARLPGTTWAN